MICDTCIIRTLSKPMSCKPITNDYCRGYARKERVMKCEHGIPLDQPCAKCRLYFTKCPDCNGTGEQPEEEVINK